MARGARSSGYWMVDFLPKKCRSVVAMPFAMPTPNTLAVHFAHHDVDAAQDHDSVGDLVPDHQLA